jgi:hypothetical protein
MSFSTPIGFLIFNRPDLTEIVFQEIAKIKPRQLFVIADGPRSPAEKEKCDQTRLIVRKVDWDCEVLTNFSEVNLGCGRRVSSGFDWVFSQVEEAIFLEDDVLPSPSFFSFCQTLLEYYRYDERVMHISGDSSVNKNITNDSYYFSKYPHIWGWASWRRAWQHYDYEMKSWPMFKELGLLSSICDRPDEQKHWMSLLDQMYADPQVIDTWDYQWLYTCWSQGGLSITPNHNLMSNIGFNREDSAHTAKDDPRSKLPTSNIWEISHPQFILRNKVADNNTYNNIWHDSLLKKLQRRIFLVNKLLKV